MLHATRYTLHATRYTLLIVFSCVLFFACEKDYENAEISKHENTSSRLKVEVLNNNEIFSNNKLVEKLNNLNPKGKKDNNARIINNQEYGFYIDTDYVKHVFDNETGQHTYNFPIIRDSVSLNSNVENLVLISNNEGTYDSFIFVYGFSHNELESLSQNSVTNYKTSIYSIDFDLSLFNSNELAKVFWECTETWTYVYGEHDGHELHGLDSNGKCIVPGCSYNGEWVLTAISCSYGGGSDTEGGSSGGSDGSAGNEYGTGNYGGSGGGSGNNNFNATPTTSLNDIYKEQVYNDFLNQLTNGWNGSPNQVDCMNSLSQENQDAIEEYIKSFDFIPEQSGDSFSGCNNSTVEDVFDAAEEILNIGCTAKSNGDTPEEVTAAIVAAIIEKQIDDCDLDPCTKGILDSIRNSQNNDIVAILTQLDNPKSIYKTKIKVQNLPGEDDLGTSQWTGVIQGGGVYTPYDYTIILDSDLVNNGTTLAIYGTLLHELIHVYFLSLIDDCHKTHNCDLLQTFPELWSYYVENNGTNSISQHNQMALSYRDVIAQGLQEFQPGLPQQYYEDLAWGGLYFTIPYNNSDPLTQLLNYMDRIRISRVNEIEAKNIPMMDTYGNLNNPKGVPCN